MNTAANHRHHDAPEIPFQIGKCPIPIIWLDTSIFLNLAMLRSGKLNKIQENRLKPLRERIHDLTRAGKLLCPRVDQPSEVWIRRSDFLDALHDLSLGITTRPRAAIKEAQIQRLMTAYIAETRSVTFPYTDAFIDDPVYKLEKARRSSYIVTVDTPPTKERIQQARSRRGTIHKEWEELRKTCIAEKTTFEQQLARERAGGMNADIAAVAAAKTARQKQMRGERLTQNEMWSLLDIGRLIRTWNRLGGKPKGPKGLLRFLNSPYYQIAPSCDISSILTAKLMVGEKKICPGDAMDVEHISSMLPYANLMVVDEAMKRIVQGLDLDTKYKTTVCYIGDSKEIEDFFEVVEKSTPCHSPFPSVSKG